MRLNNFSYVHKRIRTLCYAFEQSTQLKLVTDLSNDFNEVKFCSPLSYVTIDYEQNAIFTMCIKLNKQQFAIVREIIICLDWLKTGEQVTMQLNALQHNRKRRK